MACYVTLTGPKDGATASGCRSRCLSSAGCLGGLLGTLFGTGGPFYAINLNLRGLARSAFRATFALNFLIDGGVRLIARPVFD